MCVCMYVCVVWLAELKKEAYEFKRDIVVGAENMRTGKTIAEKVTHTHARVDAHTCSTMWMC
jgi:hypothetical protein